MKIALITYSDYYYRTILKTFEQSKRQYCENNDIDYIYVDISTDSTYKLSWRKIDILRTYLEEYDCIYITDFDSVIVNKNFNLRQLIYDNKGKDIIVNKTKTGLHLLGCSIWFNTPKSNTLLQELIDYNLRNPTYKYLAEEEIFNLIYHKTCPDIGIDSNINCICGIHTTITPFMLHYAGMGNPYIIKNEYEKTYH